MASRGPNDHEASENGITINVLHGEDVCQKTIPLTDKDGEELRVKEVKQFLLPRFKISNPDGYQLVGRLNGDAWSELDDDQKITAYIDYLTSGCVSFQSKI
ncbi:unnamed protein product [Lymnaea stagnalis]|uniref:Uncharacterized protein n=1 Tax=Lymnaea stagnalis TaxID=6523 RepID=A0AAV2HNZ0_LYMST